MANPAIAPRKTGITEKRENVIPFPGRKKFAREESHKNQSLEYMTYEINSRFDVQTEISILQRYLGEIRKFRYLTHQEERALLKLAKSGDIEARNELVTHYLALVVGVAKSYRGKKLDFLDLIQEGNLGLILEAPKGCDLSKGYRFAPYASACIRSAILLAMRDKGSLIKRPHANHVWWNKILHVSAEFVATEGREPSGREIAKATGFPLATIKRVTAGMQLEIVRLSDLIARFVNNNEPISINSVFTDSKNLDPEQIMMAKSELIYSCRNLRKLLEILKKNFSLIRQNLFKTRYGLDGTLEIKSWTEAGKKFNRGRDRSFKNIKRVWHELPKFNFLKDEVWLIGEIENIKNLAEKAECTFKFVNECLFGDKDPLVAEIEKQRSFEIEKRNQFVLENLPQIKRKAGKIYNSLPHQIEHSEQSDLVNDGVVGILMDFEKKSSEEECLKMKKYIGNRIKWKIFDALRERSELSPDQISKLKKMKKVAHDLEQEFGETPSQEDIAERSGIDAKKFPKEIKRLEIDGFDSDRNNLLSTFKNVDSKMEQDKIQQIVVKVVNNLPAKERKVIKGRYYEGLLIKEIAEEMGVSEGMISQIHTKAIAILTKKLARNLKGKINDIRPGA
jgi:RNA polymerase sigma factor FliA